MWVLVCRSNEQIAVLQGLMELCNGKKEAVDKSEVTLLDNKEEKDNKGKEDSKNIMICNVSFCDLIIYYITYL